MRKILTIIILLMLNTIAIAQLGTANNNNLIYERYALRTDLMVAQILDYPIDSNVFVNIVMLQADNDRVWGGLKKEFKEPSSLPIPQKMLTQDNPIELIIQFRNQDDPTKSAHCTQDHCLMAIMYPKKSICLFYYNTQEEMDKTIDWLMQEDFAKKM